MTTFATRSSITRASSTPASTTPPSTTPPSTTPARRSWRARTAGIAVWVCRLVLVAQFAIGGVLKLVGDPAMVAMFDDLGGRQGLRLFVGICEVAGAVGLLLPRVARLAAAGLVALMVGAAGTNVVVLQISPIVPLVLLVLATVVSVSRRTTRSAR